MTAQRPQPQLLSPEDAARIQAAVAPMAAALQQLAVGVAAHVREITQEARR